jgi:hypothetical protein
MALIFIGKNDIPAYLALSTDVSGSKIDGAIQIGKTVYLTDTSEWKIITSDQTLVDYVIPANQS